ncbi:YwaF family protein [Mycoplasmatota bacterium WC44]
MHDFFGAVIGVEKNFFSFIIPYISIISLTFLIIKFRDRLKNYRYEKILRYSFIVFMIILEVIFHIWTYVYLAKYSLTSYLFEYSMIPFHVCALSLWLIIIIGFNKSQKLFKFTFFISIMGPLLTIFGGSVDFSYDRFRYWHFYQEHINTFILAIYMMYVHDLKIEKGDWLKAFQVLAVLAVILALPLNIFLGTDFMYIYNYAHSPFEIISNKVLALIAAIILVVVFFRLIEYIFVDLKSKRKHR